jgi:uncharacterized protein (DUF983 family)
MKGLTPIRRASSFFHYLHGALRLFLMRMVGLQTLWGIVRLRCPRCCLGDVFQGRLAMNRSCPVCGLKFEREPGYFLGALYVSYPISGVILGVFMLLVHALLPDLRLELVLLIAALLYIPLMPAVFRYSRVIWIYFDRWASPSGL